MTATDIAATDEVRFPVGSLVSARGREWLVQSGSTDDLLLLRPVAGADNETVGVLPDLEPVTEASFDPPTLEDLGNDRSARLLRDAVKLGVRDVPGPFRSFGKLAVEPRSYQLVPLMMALRLDAAPDEGAHPSARLLIADDVGVGKTIEAGLIAAEMLATGAADGLSVLCPPHLADQWATELREKFHLHATKVLASTAARLERGLSHGESIFERHPVTVVSLDYIKARRRRDEYVQTAPNLVIVDEAHLCAKDPSNTSKHLRHELLTGLADGADRHLLLVTATPHSGKEGAFRSLVGLLHPDLADVDPEDELTAEQRVLLARHFVARKRIDVRHYSDQDTPFPEREDLTDEHGLWRPTAKQDALTSEVIAWARGELDQARRRGKRDERVRWWSVLGLLRALASSPAAAADTLRKRAGTAELAAEATPAEVDEAGRQTTLDVDTDDELAQAELEIGAQVTDDAERLRGFAEQAEKLAGPTRDAKLSRAAELADELVSDGLSPIFFCRFIATAKYLAEHLSRLLDGVQVVAVTGETPSDQREKDVAELATNEPKVLVATDCLSEGINLQEHFSAVVHYDLPWSPTRLEQREGRVDRYGQAEELVKVASIHGDGITIDELILDVLLRKHVQIRKSLGISIPVPGTSEELIEAAAERLFSLDDWKQEQLLSDREYQRIEADFERRWVNIRDREQRSRSKFAQLSIDPSEAAAQLAAAREATGTVDDLHRFLRSVIPALGGTVQGDGIVPGRRLTLGLDRLPAHLAAELAQALAVERLPDELDVRLERPAPPGGVLLARTHPFVEALARFVVDAAIDRHEQAPAARISVIATTESETRTAVAICRYRHHLTTSRHGQTHTILVEDIAPVALTSGGLADVDPHTLTAAEPTANLADADRREDATWALERLDDGWRLLLDQTAQQRADELLEAHRAVRHGFGAGGREARFGRSSAQPNLPPDVLAVHVTLPDRSGR